MGFDYHLSENQQFAFINSEGEDYLAKVQKDAQEKWKVLQVKGGEITGEVEVDFEKIIPKIEQLGLYERVRVIGEIDKIGILKESDEKVKLLWEEVHNRCFEECSGMSPSSESAITGQHLYYQLVKKAIADSELWEAAVLVQEGQVSDLELLKQSLKDPNLEEITKQLFYEAHSKDFKLEALALVAKKNKELALDFIEEFNNSKDVPFLERQDFETTLKNKDFDSASIALHFLGTEIKTSEMSTEDATNLLKKSLSDPPDPKTLNIFTKEKPELLKSKEIVNLLKQHQGYYFQLFELEALKHENHDLLRTLLEFSPNAESFRAIPQVADKLIAMGKEKGVTEVLGLFKLFNDFQLEYSDVVLKQLFQQRLDEGKFKAIVTFFSGKDLTQKSTVETTRIRMYQSITIMSDIAAGNCWVSADKDCEHLANKHKSQGGKLTIEDICRWNKMMASGAKHFNGGRPGVLRSNRVLTGKREYVWTPFVSKMTEETIDFINKELERDKLHPIALAGMAYQRLVSIHPFSDGNGRTCRMAMDYILRRSGYPPSCIEDHNVALFAFPTAGELDINEKALPAAEKVAAGVANTLRLNGIISDEEYNMFRKEMGLELVAESEVVETIDLT